MADSSSTKTTSKSKNEAPSCKEEVDEVKKKGIKLLIYDMKQKKLIPIKVLFFLVISSKFHVPFCEWMTCDYATKSR